MCMYVMRFTCVHIERARKLYTCLSFIEDASRIVCVRSSRAAAVEALARKYVCTA